MYDVMLDEAKLWLDERKVEESSSSPPPAPVKEEDSGYDYEYSSGEDEMDPVEEAKYLQQIKDSDGFDVDFCYHPFGGIMPCGCNDSDIPLAKLGLHCYNMDKGTNLQFRTLEKVNAEAVSFVNYYITLEAVDPDNNHSLVTFQTCVWDSPTKNKERLRLITKQCRIKPQVSDGNRGGAKPSLWQWDPKAVDEFYTCEMPNWPQDDVLTGANKLQFHEVKDSELKYNEWLNLYAEIALSSERPSYMETDLPLEVKKVVVQTKEDVEASKKLKSSNIIFYMSFKTQSRPECKAIIRQTRDGRQGHMCLEVTCMLGSK